MIKKIKLEWSNSDYTYGSLESKYRVDGFHLEASNMYTHLIIKLTTFFLNKLGEQLELPKSRSKETSIIIHDRHTIGDVEGWLLELDYLYDEKEKVLVDLEGSNPYIEVFNSKYFLEEHKEMLPPMYKAMIHNLRIKLRYYWCRLRFVKIKCGNVYYGLGADISLFKLV